jgi:predicted Rossmann fold flavoprotein
LHGVGVTFKRRIKFLYLVGLSRTGPCMKHDVIIIGGGAAGLMCAIEAGRRGRSVLLLEHNERLGKKILISGGGRCNFTNTGAGPEYYLSSNPHFCKSALARYTPADFISLVERHRIAYHEKKLGQLFCDTSSREIVDLLQRECEAAGVNIRLNCIVQEVRKPLSFEVATNLGTYTSDALVIATGGLSFAKLGATDFGYRIARQFGLNLIEPRPGLVPLTFRTDDQQTFAALSGISVDASVSHDGAIFRENILFTHRGLSGPAILQISNYCPPGRPFHIDLVPGRSALELLDAHRQSGKALKTVLAQQLPARFTQAWCERFAPSRPMHRYSNAELESIARELQRWELAAAETEGYPKAEVTLGGVDTNELSSKTMESRHVTGLFFIGEVVDVTGWLGGYNFQWAWASAHAAGGAV